MRARSGWTRVTVSGRKAVFGWMKMYPEQIVGLGGARYLARIKTVEPDEVREFQFVVEGDDIQAVVWSSDFAAFLGHNFGAARHLLQAILAFDRAQGVEISAPS
ncbi:hypothetical protein ACMHYB_57810 [Sorangium sp. So ce1128]